MVIATFFRALISFQTQAIGTRPVDVIQHYNGVFVQMGAKGLKLVMVAS